MNTISGQSENFNTYGGTLVRIVSKVH